MSFDPPVWGHFYETPSPVFLNIMQNTVKKYDQSFRKRDH